MSRKVQMNIYKGLPMVLEKVRLSALAAVVGKSVSWIPQKLTKRIINVTVCEFSTADLPLMNQAIESLGAEIEQNLIEYSTDRIKVIEQIKVVSSLVSIPYIYTEHLKVKKSWFTNRMKLGKPGVNVSSFKEEDITKINLAIIAIANELRSIEFTLE